MVGHDKFFMLEPLIPVSGRVGISTCRKRDNLGKTAILGLLAFRGHSERKLTNPGGEGWSTMVPCRFTEGPLRVHRRDVRQRTRVSTGQLPQATVTTILLLQRS